MFYVAHCMPSTIFCTSVHLSRDIASVARNHFVAENLEFLSRGSVEGICRDQLQTNRIRCAKIPHWIERWGAGRSARWFCSSTMLDGEVSRQDGNDPVTVVVKSMKIGGDL